MDRKEFTEKMAFENRGLSESVLKEAGCGAGKSQKQAERERSLTCARLRGQQYGCSRVDKEAREKPSMAAPIL